MTIIALLEVFKAADGEMALSTSLLPNTHWSCIVGYRVTGEQELIEGEPRLINNVFIFMANPATYPKDLADIYGQPIDRDDICECCEAYLNWRFQNAHAVLITPL